MREWIIKPNLYIGDDNIQRFVLGVDGSNPLICFGINPSTATIDSPDATLKKVEQFSIRGGYDGWIMLNLYAQRATYPKDLHQAVDSKLHTRNMEHITKILQRSNLTLWAAWGTVIKQRKYLNKCLCDIHQIAIVHDCHWVSYGNNTKDGHPRHPCYLSYASRSADFDVDAYIA